MIRNSRPIEVIPTGRRLGAEIRGAVNLDARLSLAFYNGHASAMPKGAGLKPAGRCIFCNGVGVTKEHMWADWLRAYIPRGMQQHTTAFNTFFPDEPQIDLRRRTGDPHSIRIRCVCRACNNGWMSQLQATAKPYLVPMLDGEKITLQRNGQQTLAAWTAMMVMVAEHLDREMVAIPRKDRCWLMKNHRPPSRWRIWIGQHRRKEHELFLHNVMALATEDEIKRLPAVAAAQPNTQTTTVCLGDHLVIHTLSSDRVWGFVRHWSMPPPVDRTMLQIWPIKSSSITWPTSARALTDEGLSLLSMTFFNDMRVLSEATGRSD